MYLKTEKEEARKCKYEKSDIIDSNHFTFYKYFSFESNSLKNSSINTKFQEEKLLYISILIRKNVAYI